MRTNYTMTDPMLVIKRHMLLYPDDAPSYYVMLGKSMFLSV